MKTELEDLTKLTLSNQSLGSKTTITDPAWSASPTLTTTTTQSFTISLLSNTAGETACIAVKETDNTTFESDVNSRPTAEQIYLLLDNNNVSAPGNVIVSDITQSSNSLQISGLTSGTVYYVFCTAVDDVPLWPTHMLHLNGIDYIRATTESDATSPDDDDDSAELLSNKVIETLLMVMIFIFN